MEVFHLEKKILKYCGIERNPSKRMKYVLNVLKLLNYFAMIFCILTSAFYVLATKDILDIAESMATGTTAFIMLIKYAVFCRKSEEIFASMDEIEELNENYKDLKNALAILSESKKLSVIMTTPLKWGCIVTPIFYIMKPLTIDIIYYFYYGIATARGVPFKAKFFYDVTQSPAYELTFLIQTYGTSIVCAYIVRIKIFNIITGLQFDHRLEIVAYLHKSYQEDPVMSEAAFRSL
ncbi:hypothetical protein ACKWTF_005364 [Chironomus riparius]